MNKGFAVGLDHISPNIMEYRRRSKLGSSLAASTPASIVRLNGEDVVQLILRHNPLMHTSVARYHRHRFPTEIISHCVWLYFRFALSFRDVEEMMASRGVCLTYETVREWCFKYGQTYANGLRRRSARPGTSGTWMRCS